MFMNNFYRRLLMGTVIGASATFAGYSQEIKLEVSNVTARDAEICITPSEGVRYFYSLVTEDEYAGRGGDDGILDWHIAGWKDNYWGDPWEVEMSYYLYDGVRETSGKQMFRAGLEWDKAYVLYAFGMAEDGTNTVPVVTERFHTLALPHSDNTFQTKVLSVGDDGSGYYKKVTVKVTPTNDDPYAVLVQEARYVDSYDGSEGKTEEDYFKHQFVGYVYDVYTGEQTLEFPGLRADKDHYVVVAGYEDGPTTGLYATPFKSSDMTAGGDDERDLSFSIAVSDVTIRNASITITPSDPELPYYFYVMPKEKFESIGGKDAIFEEFDKTWWEYNASWYEDTEWTDFLPLALVSGEQSFTLEDVLSYLPRWETDLVVYAYGLDFDGVKYTPVEVAEFSTLPRNHSDLTFKLELEDIGVDPNSTSGLKYIAHVKVTPSDPDATYSMIWHKTIFYDKYTDNADLTMDDYLFEDFAKYVTDTYTGTQTFELDELWKGDEYYCVVAGFDEAPNTDPFVLALKPGQEAERKDAFKIEVSDISVRDAYITITPPDEEMPYYWFVMRKEKYERYGGDEGIFEQFDKEWYEFVAEISQDPSLTWFDFMSDYLQSGSDEMYAYSLYEGNPLEWDTEFVVYAYGMGDDGVPTTAVSSVEFRTLPRNINEHLTIGMELVSIEEDTDNAYPNMCKVTVKLTPSDDSTYAVHCHEATFYDWYIGREDYTWEDYLIKQFDPYCVTHEGEDTITFINLKKGKDYYVVATGYDEAPNTEIFKIRFTADATGIEFERIDAPEDVEFYDLNGRRVDANSKGIRIIRSSDGTVRKSIRR